MEGYHFRNWARTYECYPEKYFEPEDIDQLRAIIREAREKKKKVRVCGYGHSPSDICCTDDYLIRLTKFDRIINVDEQRRTVEAQAGALLVRLVDKLKDHNLALSVLPASGDFTLAGTVSVCTHGSGADYPALADYVNSLSLLTADDRILRCSREENPDVFHAVCGGFGTLGVILSMELQCEEYYNLKQLRYPMEFDDFADSVEELCRESQHFRANYYPYTDRVAVSSISRSRIAATKRSPSIFQRLNRMFQKFLINYVIEFCLFLSVFLPRLLGVTNRLAYYWLLSKFAFVVDGYERISFGHIFTYHQLVSEWNVPVDRCAEAVRRLKSAIDRYRFPAHFAIEVRFMRRDSFWLSPAYNRDVAAINIITYCPYDWQPAGWTEYWTTFAAIMQSMDGRPHLAKTHPMTKSDMIEAYPRFQDFLNLRRRLDPDGLFMNEYARRVLGNEEVLENGINKG